MTRVPPLRTCAECGRNVGRAWAAYQLCKKCGQVTIDQLLRCTCQDVLTFDPDCPVHQGRNPYDIPF